MSISNLLKKAPAHNYTVTLLPEKYADDFLIAYVLQIARSDITFIEKCPSTGTKVYFWNGKKYICPKKEWLFPAYIGGYWKAIGKYRGRYVSQWIRYEDQV